MPAKSRAQQRFFGVVKGIQKGTGRGAGKAKTAARDMSPEDVDDFASTPHKGLPDRVKQETKVRQLIRKMVREIMAEIKEGGPGSGPHPDDEDNPFDREPSDDELKDIEKQFEGDVLDKEREKQRADKEKFRDRQFKDMERARDREKRLKKNEGVGKTIAKIVDEFIEEGFAGGLPKDIQKKFEKHRREQAEVLGYTLTGKDDVKAEIGKLTESQQVAKTILQQLGGNRFIAMTGAKNFGSSKNSLQFKIGRNSKSISHVIITLKSSDLYDVEFIRIRGVKRTVVKKLKGVYADQLGTMFKKYTGMNVRL